jgi:hypothetical protein
MKFGQKSFNQEHEIGDLQQTSLEIDSQNGIASLTHIFFMYNLFLFKVLLCSLNMSRGDEN